MATSVQSYQQHFTVVRLPILQIVLESLVMPFKHFQVLIRFGWVPLAGSFLLLLLSWLTGDFALPTPLNVLWMPIAVYVLYAPFSVAWTRVAVDGPRAALPDHPFRFGRAELQYLLPIGVFLIASIVLIALPASLYHQGKATFDKMLTFIGALLCGIGAIVLAIGSVRLVLAVPAIAMEQYQGLLMAWRNSAGNFESIAAAIALALMPYYVVAHAIHLGIGGQPGAIPWLLNAAVQTVLGGLSTTATVAAWSLAYKAIVLGGGPLPSPDSSVTTV